MSSKRMLSALTLLFSITACDFITAGERTAPASSNTASTLLIETASRQYAEGKLDQAAASLERALQIQPNNPATLHYLGVLRLQQGQYEQAEVLAARSNLRVGRNVALRNRNLQLIEAANQARISGTPPGAVKASAVQVIPAEASPETARSVSLAAAQQRQGVAGQQRVGMPEYPMDETAFEVPRGHRPPPGKCRIWYPDRPPGHQPPPGKCKKLQKHVPAGAYLLRH
ncbi:lipopolysaccharide assembly protein LapB [Pseudomonas sp. LAIL14HWK12:I7]|uniref:tetratricopeptide repeat protein n=1 Tax=Pseudomonas sp. LAIL14HWK12:I7 TaxID=1259801 RepID=UPI000480F09E|nr:tetratricopeptide repeat protein [Pseudomonas sp. LAIL14HWK12:I7]